MNRLQLDSYELGVRHLVAPEILVRHTNSCDVMEIAKRTMERHIGEVVYGRIPATLRHDPMSGSYIFEQRMAVIPIEEYRILKALALANLQED